MSACCCSLAGTAACQHCANNPFATDVWSNVTTSDRTWTGPFGNGSDVCPVCGKPSDIGKRKTVADKIREMSDETMAYVIARNCECSLACEAKREGCCRSTISCQSAWLAFLKQEDK